MRRKICICRYLKTADINRNFCTLRACRSRVIIITKTKTLNDVRVD